MAKISLKTFLTHGYGGINSAAVASIKRPSSPLVFGKNQQSDTLYMPRYNRQEPKGGQIEQRARYCECAQIYARFELLEKKLLMYLAGDYNRRHPNQNPLTGYTYFLKICLADEPPLRQVDQVHIEGWYLAWTDRTFDIPPGGLNGMALLRCEGAYNSGYGYPGEGVWCPVYDNQEQGLIHAWCNSRIQEDDNYLGPYLNLNLEVDWITEYAHGHSDIWIPLQLESLQIGVLTSEYVFVYHDLTYTLFDVII